MNLEQSRLDTFQSWPANAEVEPQRIAKAGFFYTGSGLIVECFCCGGRISDWNYSDQVMARHRQLNPDCPFVKDPVSSGNIPVVNRSPSLFSQSSDPNTSLQSNRDLSFSASQSVNLPNVGESSGLNSNDSLSRRSALNSVSSIHMTMSVNNSLESNQMNEDISPYRNEAVRLESFASWPKSHIVSPRLLAKTGFFYLQEGDRVQCAFCLGKVHGWERGDDPEREHRRHFPSCPLLNSLVTNRPSDTNVDPIQSSSNEVILEEIRPFSGPEREPVIGRIEERIHPSLNELGIHTHRGPIYPKYSTVESRLRTFDTWPHNIHQTPQQLAQAGFYYTGNNDQVRCFHCDGGLRQWDEHDDPWIEHARWFSRCTYVLLVKGEDFVQQSISQHPPYLPASELQNRDNVPLETEHIVYRVHEVTEEELDNLMTTPEVRVALDVGLDSSKIKQVLRRKMEQSGLPFACSDTLIEAVLDLSSDTNSTESPIEECASSSNEIEREDIQQNAQTSTSNSEEQRVPLSVSKSLPSITGFFNEPALQGNEVNTQSMPLLLQEKIVKKSFNVGKFHSFTLEEENRRLKEARLCKICMDEEVGVVFVPCGHLVTCVNCAANVQDCPMCRKPIKATVRTFLS